MEQEYSVYVVHRYSGIILGGGQRRHFAPPENDFAPPELCLNQAE